MTEIKELRDTVIDLIEETGNSELKAKVDEVFKSVNEEDENEGDDNCVRPIEKYLSLRPFKCEFFEGVNRKTGNKTVTCVLSSQIEKRNWKNYNIIDNAIWNTFTDFCYSQDGHKWDIITTKSTVECKADDKYSFSYGSRLAENLARAKSLKTLSKRLEKVAGSFLIYAATLCSETDRYNYAAIMQDELVKKIVDEGVSQRDLDKDFDAE